MRTLRRVELLILLMVFAWSFSMVSARAQYEEIQKLFEQAQGAQQEGREKDALELYERAVAEGEKLGPNKRGFAVILNNLAGMYMVKGQYERANTLFRRAAEISKKNFGPDSPDYVMSLSNLSLSLSMQGKTAEAEKLLESVLEISLLNAESRPEGLFFVSDSLATLYEGEQRYKEAEEVLQRALEHCESKACKDFHFFDRLQSHLARLYQDQGKPADAEYAVQKLPDAGLNGRDLAMARQLVKEGSLTHAEALYQNVIARLEREYKPEDPVLLIQALMELGDLYREEHSDALGEQAYLRAEKIEEEAIGAGRKDVAAALWVSQLLNLYRDQGRMSEAEQFLRRVLVFQFTALGPERNEVAVSMTTLARLLDEEEKFADAAPFYKRAAEIYEKNYGEDARTVQGLSDYAAALDRIGEKEEAAAVRSRVKRMLLNQKLQKSTK